MMFYRETSPLKTPPPPKCRQKYNYTVVNSLLLAKIMQNSKVWAIPLLRFLTLCLLLTFYKKGVTRRDNWVEGEGVCSYIRVHLPYKQSLSKEISGVEHKSLLIYSCSALVISFESDCFYCMWTWIYECVPPPPPQLSRLVATLFIRPDHL